MYSLQHIFLVSVEFLNVFVSRTSIKVPLWEHSFMTNYFSISHYVIFCYLQRHFAVFSLAAPEGEGLKNVVHCVLEAHMTQNDSPGLVIDLHNAIVQASCRLLQLTQRTLKAADMPGREYYAFSLRDINNCFMVRNQSDWFTPSYWITTIVNK